MKKFISLLLGFLISFVISSCEVSAENIKFAQITDVHLSANSEFSINVLKTAIQDINSQPEISFVVFTGDNISNPKEENLKVFAKEIKKLKVPYYVAVGNHDVYKSGGLSKVKYYEILREANPFLLQRSANYKFRRNGFVFLVVDGAKEVIPGSVGYYREDTLKWLEKELSQYDKKQKQVIILQHFPVEYPQGVESSLRTHKTYKVESYKEILSKYHNVLAVITGHFHVNSEQMNDGVYHISSPSLLQMPNAYKIIDIVTTKEFSPIIYTRLKEFEVKEQE